MMKLALLARIGSSLIVASLVTGGLYWLNTQKTAERARDRGFRWARQVASQVESMTFNARELGQRDPLGWAVNYLTQGVEPRVMKITKWQSEPGKPGGADGHHFEPQTGIFEYQKVINEESGSGVRIFLNLGYTGFAGAGTKLGSDFLAFCLFLVIGLGSFLGSGRLLRMYGPRPDPNPPQFIPLPPVPSVEDPVHELLRSWVPRFRASLSRTGSHFRDTVRNALTVIQAAKESRQAVAQLGQKIHEGLNEVHQARRALTQNRELAALTESLAERLLEEHQKGGGLGKTTGLANELHLLTQKLLQNANSSEKALKEMETRLEPWTVDADQASLLLQNVLDGAFAMSADIDKTRGALVDQSRLSQEIQPPASTEKRAMPEPLPVSA